MRSTAQAASRPLAQLVRRMFVSADILSQAPDNGTVVRLGERCFAEFSAFEQHWTASEEQLDAAPAPVAFVVAWLEVMRDEQLVQRALKMLGVLAGCCDLVRSGATDDARQLAVYKVASLGQIAILPLGRLVTQLIRMRAHNAPCHQPLVLQLGAEMTSADLLAALAAAFDGVAATYDLLGCSIYCFEPDTPSSEFRRRLVALNRMIEYLVKHVEFTACTLLDAAHERAGSGSGPQPPLPAAVARLVGALASSQLLPAMCRAVLRPPDGFDRGQGPSRDVLEEMHGASDRACRSLSAVLLGARELHVGGYGDGDQNSPPAGAVSPGEPLLALLAHPDVHRLQRAALGRLIAHGGGGGGGGDGGSSGGGRGDGWVLALEEARQGRALLPLSPSPESYHSMVLQASLYTWAVMLQQRGRVTNGTPPQREVAALAAAAARAVCRVQRGQGMAGLHDNPAWVLPGSLMPGDGFSCKLHLALLPTAEARAVAPDWLEAAAWAAAAAVDALAAGGPASGEPRRLLTGHLGSLVWITSREGTGLASLSPAAQRDCRARLAAAGTLLTLDTTLRLSAADTARAAAAATAATDPNPDSGWPLVAVCHVANLLQEPDALPILPAEQQQGGRQGKGLEGDQLGVLVTAAKWSRLLAVGWDAPPMGAGRLAAAVAVTDLVRATLAKAMANVAVGLWPRLAAAAAEAAVAAAATEAAAAAAAANTAAAAVPAAAPAAAAEAVAVAVEAAAAVAAHGGDLPDPRVRCISVEHEAYALAARSTCMLAVPIALIAARGGAAMSELDPAQLKGMVAGVASALVGLTTWVRRGSQLPLPAGQVLGAQPHRLLAAAAQLLSCAPQLHVSLASALVVALAALAAHEQLSARLRVWLAVPALAQASGSGGRASGADGGGERGCLCEAMKGTAPRLLQFSRAVCGMVLGLLRRAAADESGGSSGAGGSSEDDFRSAGVAMMDQLFGSRSDAGWMMLPDGSSTDDLVREVEARGVGFGAGPAGEVAALPAALKHFGPSGQLRRLRVCGHPHCDNFGAASEGQLPLKQCSGCRAVRYCRAECQKAHWQAAHRAECAQLAGRG